MQIEAATAGDFEAAVGCAVAAFSDDPIVSAFFDDSPIGRTEASRLFFGFLLEARLALGMPVLVARNGGQIIGLAMGMDATGAEWPAETSRRWDAFVARNPGVAGRIATYEAIVDAARLTGPNWYLGVLAVDPSIQGTGIGTALLRAFLDLVDADPASIGTSLETGSPANCRFYHRFGFQERTAGALGAATLCVLYRPRPT